MSIPDILQEIVETKKGEVAAAKGSISEAALKARCEQLKAVGDLPRNFFAALIKEPDGLVNVIAEVKRSSPSVSHENGF